MQYVLVNTNKAHQIVGSFFAPDTDAAARTARYLLKGIKSLADSADQPFVKAHYALKPVVAGHSVVLDKPNKQQKPGKKNTPVHKRASKAKRTPCECRRCGVKWVSFSGSRDLCHSCAKA